MRIAIVAPSPNPFVVGGAENLWWGMLDHLNRESGHVADLVKLPVKETSLADLVSAYEAFSRLDLSGFDAVISTKYPAWMVSHPNHRVFLQHRCRGYYDWYPPDLPPVYAGRDPEIRALLDYVDHHREQRESLPAFFARFRSLVAARPNDPELLRHPGPVGRAIIHYLDGVGLARTGIRRYAAIAETVKRRPGYFPEGADVKVVFHPTNKTGFRDEAEEYFFTVSRFYPSKRIALLIDAFRRTKIPVPFKIAGTGDEEAMLRERAAGDPRIEFVGFVRDDELIELYARAMAVPFVPADEDFGYITLEAMLAGKTVITTSDSGGPLELVRDGETGVVAEPDPDSLARAFERVHAERDWARGLARRGHELAQTITWKKLFDTLLGDDAAPARARPPRPARPRITVLNAYGVHPPSSGGSYRLHCLYKALSRHIDVDLVTLGLHGQGDDAIHVCDGLRELRVERTKAHDEADFAAQVEAQTPVYDITAIENIRLTPAYVTVLENSLAGSRAVLVSHPYMLGAVRATGYAGPMIHESHNCEHVLKSRMLPDTPARERLLAVVEDAEGHCVRDSVFTFATCEGDVQELARAYGVPAESMMVIPNGTDTNRIAYAGPDDRRRLKRRLRIGKQPVALFLASGHRPNLEAAEHIFGWAQRMPDVAFALVGNAADAFLHRALPSNVWLVGVVGEEERNVWLEASDVALNPMLYGGGTNLKLLDYFAAGTPVVSTGVGIRGTGVEEDRHALVGPVEDFEPLIRAAIAGGPAIERMTAEARRLVEERFDWQMLADRLFEEMTARRLV